MKTLLFVGAVVALMAAVALLKAHLRGGSVRKGTFGPRPALTKNEQGMYWRLVQSFPEPEHVVLSQVSFGALLVAKRGASRYSFSQKRADFVLLDKTFRVLAVIELDDSSHRGQETRDAQRDSMLLAAGYKVLRYSGIPDVDRLVRDVFPPPPPPVPVPKRAQSQEV